LIDRLVRKTPNTTPAQLTCLNATTVCNKIRMQASNANTDTIFIGLHSTFTEIQAIAELSPGSVEWFGDEEYDRPLDVSQLYVRARNGSDALIGAAFVR
jgi:hypothetical protein